MAPKPNSHARGSPPTTPQGRSIQISKALSWLLRHGAAKERIAMDMSGHVNLQDVLNWHKLKAINAHVDDVIEVVRSNEKQRFGLRWDGEPKGEGEGGGTEHQIALARIEAAEGRKLELDAREYSIRAVQGHSIRGVEAAALLVPILVENAPGTCVHGTYFSAWPAILRTGGLKSMTRNHVHFASGPAVGDVLGDKGRGDEEKEVSLKESMRMSEVVSGMRWDAEMLIYVDLKRSIEEGGMEWWKSENGVILTEGLIVDGEVEGEGEEAGEKAAEGRINVKSAVKKPAQPSKTPQMLVPMAYWDIVVGIGVGVLWERGKGVVQEVPPDMMTGGKKKKFAPGGKPRSKNKGRGSDKAKMMVERDDMDGFD